MSDNEKQNGASRRYDKKPYERKSYGGDKKSYGGDKKSYGGDKKSYGGDKKSYGGKKQYGDKSGTKYGEKKYSDKKPYGKSYGGYNNGGKRDYRNDSFDLPTPEPPPEAENTAPPATPIKKVMIRQSLISDSAKSDEKDEKVTVSEVGAAADGDAQFDGRILYEDNHLLVVIKPQNMPTQSDSSGDNDLLSELKKYLVKKYDKPGEAYLGLLHRLDRPTGGIMVFAKTSKAAGRLSEQIREGEFEKQYAAVTAGKPNKTGRISHYLYKDTQTNTVSVVPFTLEGAKLAESEVSVVDSVDDKSLVSVKLLTGRTHQVRVQLKALGAPILGDGKYGGEKFEQSPHLALWAYRLMFTHPVTGDLMLFVSQPPQEYPWTLFNTEALVEVAKPQTR